MKLNPDMIKAIEVLRRGPATAAALGAELTGRKDSAIQGSRILNSLRRRGLAFTRFDRFSGHFVWELTAKGDAAP